MSPRTATLPPIPDCVELCVAAFLNDRKCRKLLDKMLDGTPILTLQLNETVLRAIDFDPRSWREWDEPVAEAVKIVTRDRKKARSRRKAV